MELTNNRFKKNLILIVSNVIEEQIKKAVNKAKAWFLIEKSKGKESRIYKVSKFYLRGADLTIDYDEALGRLNNIKLIYNNIEQQYGETDGINIVINTFYNFNVNELKLLLIHEAIHFIIKKDGIHGISEKKEHRIMEVIDPQLI